MNSFLEKVLLRIWSIAVTLVMYMEGHEIPAFMTNTIIKIGEILIIILLNFKSRKTDGKK